MSWGVTPNTPGAKPLLLSKSSITQVPNRAKQSRVQGLDGEMILPRCTETQTNERDRRCQVVWIQVSAKASKKTVDDFGAGQIFQFQQGSTDLKMLTATARIRKLDFAQEVCAFRFCPSAGF